MGPPLLQRRSRQHLLQRRAGGQRMAAGAAGFPWLQNIEVNG